MTIIPFRTALLAAGLIAMSAVSAAADDRKIEIGASLASATIGIGDNEGTTIGIPSGGFNLLSPGVYASFFVTPHFAVEPQLGLMWVSSHGHSDHVLNFTGQIDYFFSGNAVPSLYAFGAAGVIDTSGSSVNPKALGAGIGYRAPVGGRLTLRVDGRVTHFTEGGGNAVGLMLSIGGLF